MKMTNWTIAVAMAGVTAVVSLWPPKPLGGLARAADQIPANQPVYRSPWYLAVSPDGQTLYASDRTAGCVTILDAVKLEKRRDILLDGEPRGLALSTDGNTLYVAQYDTGTVAVIDTNQAAVTGRIKVGLRPTGVAFDENNQRLYVCNQQSHSVSLVPLGQGSLDAGNQNQSSARPATMNAIQIAVVREPVSAAVSPQGDRVVVTNLLPHGVATDPMLAAEVSILDGSSHTQRATVALPPGSTAARSACISPDGKWAYVVHSVGRFNLPITQLERGWVNTYGLSIIDLAEGTRLVTLLLDDLTQGAADPYAVVCSADGSRLWIAHAGVHEVSFVDIGRVHSLLEGKVPEDLASLRDGTRPNIWVLISQDRKNMAELANDLTALYIAGAIRRAPSGGIAPRGLALSPDGSRLYVANYYSGSVAVLDSESGALLAEISLGENAEPDAVRRGEIIFHDATRAFQRWHSCATCHPNDGRVDGLRWDFLRDGIGNGKDTPSLILVDQTEPLNRRATRKDVRQCAETGLLTSHMIVHPAADVDDLRAYLVSLRPEPNPHRTPDGQLSEAAERGKTLFEGKANCAHCHPAPYFTDKKMHNVGVLSPNEPDGRYDTPTLVEAYRTAPYLHDGRALSIKDALTVYNADGRHGNIKRLSEQELDDLVEYVRSL